MLSLRCNTKAMSSKLSLFKSPKAESRIVQPEGTKSVTESPLDFTVGYNKSCPKVSPKVNVSTMIINALNIYFLSVCSY